MININLLRVSADSEYLEFVVECSTGYIFNTLFISRYNTTLKVNDEPIDASSVLSGTGSSEVIRIRTAGLGIPGDANVTMYQVEFGVTAIDFSNPATPEIPTKTGICSNVNFVYARLLDLVMGFVDCCISDADYANMNRNHMILYAHQEAMRLGRYVEAKYFYDIIWKNFANCSPTARQIDTRHSPCNCG